MLNLCNSHLVKLGHVRDKVKPWARAPMVKLSRPRTSRPGIWLPLIFYYYFRSSIPFTFIVIVIALTQGRA